MATIKPRMKWVAEMDNARLSYAEVAAVLGHEIMADKLGEETSIEWYGNVPEEEKTRILLSVLGCRNGYSVWYPEGKKTCYKFNAYDSECTRRQVYDYMFWARINSADRGVVNCGLMKHGRIIATVNLDMDYFEFLGSLDFGGSDDEWDLVED